MTTKQALIIVASWLVVIAAFAAIYFTERGVLCWIAMAVLSAGVTSAVIATVFSDGNRTALAE